MSSPSTSENQDHDDDDRIEALQRTVAMLKNELRTEEMMKEQLKKMHTARMKTSKEIINRNKRDRRWLNEETEALMRKNQKMYETLEARKKKHLDKERKSHERTQKVLKTFRAARKDFLKTRKKNLEGGANSDNDINSCQICNNTFATCEEPSNTEPSTSNPSITENRLPLVLQCGHTICALCFDELKRINRNNAVECPFDRTVSKGNSRKLNIALID